MNEFEQYTADKIALAIQRFTTNTERGQQAREFRVGVSDLGYCSERTRRMLEQQVPEDSDMFKAFIGTALGDHIEQAVVANPDLFPGAIRQAEVTLRLQGENRTYEVTGHPDLIIGNLVLDAKTSDGLALARRLGADQQKQFQRHGYGLAAWEAGLLGDIELAEVMVGNVWIDRSGDEPEPHVEIEPLDLNVIAEAARWLDAVVYAYINNESAMKEPAREVCAVTCGFFRVCREFDTDVSGLLTDPEVVAAIEMYNEGLGLEREGKSLKNQAKPVLRGIAGSTGTHMLRWVFVPETAVKESTRRAYDKIDLRPIK